MRHQARILVVVAALPFIAPGLAHGQIVVQDLASGVTAQDLVDKLLGSAVVTVSNVTYTGADIAAGLFSGGGGIIDCVDGIVLSSGDINSIPGPNTSASTSTNNGQPGDVDLDGLITQPTLDATILEFDFVISSDMVTFKYIFSSEEYNEFVNTPFNDPFGFFLNGTNVALLPDNITPVTINNVNGGNPFGTGASNPAFYINNDLNDPGPATINIEMDGFTVTLTVVAPVNPAPAVNHIKLAISDASDFIYDSNVFIQTGSFAPLFVASVDIKPGSCPNSFNRRNRGVLPVAVLGTADIDVTLIDLSTVQLSRSDGLGGSVDAIRSAFEDVATVFDGELCDCHELGGDGVMDLSIKFPSQLVTGVLQLDEFSKNDLVSLDINGFLLDGSAFRGSDCIRIVK